ncbi:serine hydrolase domain-containing protein [Saccharibacillus kuerlensis]|uniref:Beta-lactamase-related domain-containing protein n=1 Tax=Saccharibacillus kuerlensis TaxID=459527 RepID=A0ABQ2KZ67_9BACL|nr:serine hydrolase [Saccharibacillus kuerlensis]GGN97674.1 hypothetical protein GCM10010969_15750 [Saccharibacillus kuerlensis]
MSSALTKYAELPEVIQRAGLEVNGLVLLSGGHIVVEWYREPYRRGVPQLLYSLSKSVTSIAVGIACDLGLLRLDDRVISFFPNKLPLGAELSPHLDAMKVRHLLSMTAGHEEDIYPAVVSQRDWAAAFLNQPVQRVPGTHYRYSTPSTYMLSAIVERVSRMNLVDFLMPTLFGPLGIDRPTWETCPLGAAAGGMGLSLSTEDVAKFGQMLLDGGVYEGQQIVSADYIRLATSEQSDNRKGARPERVDSAQGYGFQFHLCRFGAYRGDGSFGQLCLVSPKHNLVVAANCAFPSMTKLQTLLDLIFELAEEETGHLKKTAANPSGGNRIENGRCRRFDTVEELGLSRSSALRSPSNSLRAAQATRWLFAANREFVLDENPDGLRSIAFYSIEKDFELKIDYGEGDERSGMLPFDFTHPLESEHVFVKDLSLHRQRVVTSVEVPEETERILQMKLQYIETPYIVTYTVYAAACGIRLSFELNVSFGFRSYEVFGRIRGKGIINSQ